MKTAFALPNPYPISATHMFDAFGITNPPLTREGAYRFDSGLGTGGLAAMRRQPRKAAKFNGFPPFRSARQDYTTPQKTAYFRLQLAAVGESKVKFGDIPLSELSAAHLATLRDARFGMVVAQRQLPDLPAPAPKTTLMPSTVNRELNLVSNVFTVARREWKWLAENPTRDVRRPRG